MRRVIRSISTFLTSILLTSLFISFPLYADQSETECLSVSSDYEFTASTAVTATWPSHANSTGKIYLKVQSWGSEYYIDYDEFVDYNDSVFRQGGLFFID